MSVSFSDAQYVQPQKKKNKLVRNIVTGGLVTGGLVAYHAFNKENRVDGFVNTTKNCFKGYTNSERNFFMDVAKTVKLDKVSNWLGKVSNKKMCAALLAIDTLCWGSLVGSIADWIKGD